MSHKQSISSSAIPFSWEVFPGVPKLIASPAAASSIGGLDQEVSKNQPPPPPPPLVSLGGQMKRSMSSRVFSREDDPFLAALKECSKDYKGKGDMKKRFGIWGSKSFSWCRCSFDVEEGNLRGRPVIPQERLQSLIRLQKAVRK